MAWDTRILALVGLILLAGCLGGTPHAGPIEPGHTVSSTGPTVTLAGTVLQVNKTVWDPPPDGIGEAEQEEYERTRTLVPADAAIVRVDRVTAVYEAADTAAEIGQPNRTRKLPEEGESISVRFVRSTQPAKLVLTPIDAGGDTAARTPIEAAFENSTFVFTAGDSSVMERTVAWTLPGLSVGDRFQANATRLAEGWSIKTYHVLE